MSPAIGADERLRVTMLFSAVVHAVLILGISFTYEDPADSMPSLDVILVQSSSTTTPKDADFLANASQLGGGESEKSSRPRQPETSPIPKARPGQAPLPQKAGAPKPQQATPRAVLAGGRNPDFQVDAVTEQQREVPKIEAMSAEELIERSLEMAQLAAEVDRQREQYAKRPRRKFISANTREYVYAAYMRAWVAKIERIGALNFPEEAARRGIFGQVVLTAAVRRDGTLESVEMITPSGHDFLDQAAVRIVEMGAPFSPLPPSDEQIDVLHITRTVQFLSGSVVRGQ